MADVTALEIIARLREMIDEGKITPEQYDEAVPNITAASDGGPSPDDDNGLFPNHPEASDAP